MQKTLTWWAAKSGCLLLMTALISGCDRQEAEKSYDSTSGPYARSTAAVITHSAESPWVVDPAEPGPDLPPAGRSLFDFLITMERVTKAIQSWCWILTSMSPAG